MNIDMASLAFVFKQLKQNNATTTLKTMKWIDNEKVVIVP